MWTQIPFSLLFVGLGAAAYQNRHTPPLGSWGTEHRDEELTSLKILPERSGS